MEQPRKAGIYIDISNFEKSLEYYNNMGLSFDYSRLIRSLSEGHALAVLRGYDGYVRSESERTGIQTELENVGVKLELFRCQSEGDGTGAYSCRQKEVDTAITTDVSWDLARGVVDVAFIVSGDRDMCPAYRRAKREGCDVRIVALRSNINDSYCYSMDDCVFADDLEVFLVCGGTEEGTAANTASFSVTEGVTAVE